MRSRGQLADTLLDRETVTQPDTTRLSEVLDGHENILVYCHMNPDPDSIGAGLAMQQLLEARFGKRTQIVYRGIIGRAQNREMVRRLAPSMKRFRDVDLMGYTAAILVDAQPQFGFERGADLENDVPLIGCVDHHPYVQSTDSVPYHDVQPGIGATSTIMTGYLRLFSVVPTAAVATALFYGIKTDTLGLTRRTSESDREAYDYLLPFVDHQALTAIEQPPLSPTYFRDLKRALDSARVYGKLVVSELASLSYPDMVAEIADLFLKVDKVSWSVAIGYHENLVYVSVRTLDPTGDAGIMISKIVGQLGRAGGHNTMAAARIQLDGQPNQYETLVATIRSRVIEYLGETPANGVELAAY